LDIDFGFQRLVHRTTIRDLRELRALLVCDVAGEVQRELDAIDPADFGFAVGAMFRVDPMPQFHPHMFERNFF
jgi:hypothetical protein